MHFRGFDLNLLLALDHLLTQRSVSRAAEKLNRNQSTVSGMLARLREHFDDELLVQVGREMVPTTRGLELASEVRDLLLRIDAQIMTVREFDPVTSERTIRIFASDYLMIAGLSGAMHAIQKLAPKIKFVILQPSQFQRDRDSPEALMGNGEIDLLAMPQSFMSPAHPHLPLFTETFCCLLCENNTRVGERLALKEFLELPHVTVGFGPMSKPSYEDWFDREYGEGLRRIEMVAASFATMPFLLPGTDRVALTHRRLATAFKRMLPLRMVEAPVTFPPLVEAVQWHRLSATDRGLMWVRDQLVAHMGNTEK